MQQHERAACADIVALAVDEAREYLERGAMPAVLIEDAIGALLFQFEALRVRDIAAAERAEAAFRAKLGGR